jgi:hypothetical protein
MYAGGLPPVSISSADMSSEPGWQFVAWNVNDTQIVTAGRASPAASAGPPGFRKSKVTVVND